jgi:hypothetical protein
MVLGFDAGIPFDNGTIDRSTVDNLANSRTGGLVRGSLGI